MGNSYDIVLTGTAPARMTSPCHLRAFAIGVATIHTNNIPAQIPGRAGPTVRAHVVRGRERLHRTGVNV